MWQEKSVMEGNMWGKEKFESEEEKGLWNERVRRKGWANEKKMTERKESEKGKG